jgi:hypothetical protein
MKITEEIYNIQTKETKVIEREETAQEQAERLESKAQVLAAQAEAEAKATAKSALLEKLGITAEEAALLLS